MQSRNSCKKHNRYDQSNGVEESKKESDQLTIKEKHAQKSRRKRGNFRSLQVLAAILLSRMGRMGAMDILSLVAVAVCVLNE